MLFCVAETPCGLSFTSRHAYHVTERANDRASNSTVTCDLMSGTRESEIVILVDQSNRTTQCHEVKVNV